MALGLEFGFGGSTASWSNDLKIQSSEKWIGVSSVYRIQQQHQLDISQTAHDMGRGVGRATRFAECLSWVKLRNTHHEQISSALPPRTDIDLARRFGSNVSRIQCCGSVEVRLAALRRVNGARIISPRSIVLVCRKPYDNLRSD